MEFYKLHDLIPEGLNPGNKVIKEIFAGSEFIPIFKNNKQIGRK